MKQLGLLDMSAATPASDKSASKQKASPSAPHLYSVSELNDCIRNQLENKIGTVWLHGEVSNCIHHGSGHCYFSLKDDAAELRAVMFRSTVAKLKFKLKNGIECKAKGKVTLYPARGSTQIVCTYAEPIGQGALQLAYEQLKKQLHHEGLFERRKPLPKLPRRIAIISSPTGAAIQDVLKVLKRRNPLVPVMLIPSRVEGEAAVPDLLHAIQQAHKLNDVDVLLVTRGGGSIEDLWCFNDERVARALAVSPKVVVSAIGHEIDHTICDYVADRRAPTPSAAAEILVPHREQLLQHISQLQHRQHQAVRRALNFLLQRQQNLNTRLGAQQPLRRVQNLMQRHDEVVHRLTQGAERFIKVRHQRLALLQAALFQNQDQNILRFRSLWQQQNARLGALNPTRVLERGFSVLKKEGRVVRDAAQLQQGDRVDVQLARGTARACITSTRAG